MRFILSALALVLTALVGAGPVQAMEERRANSATASLADSIVYPGCEVYTIDYSFSVDDEVINFYLWVDIQDQRGEAILYGQDDFAEFPEGSSKFELCDGVWDGGGTFNLQVTGNWQDPDGNNRSISSEVTPFEIRKARSKVTLAPAAGGKLLATTMQEQRAGFVATSTPGLVFQIKKDGKWRKVFQTRSATDGRYKYKPAAKGAYRAVILAAIGYGKSVSAIVKR